MPKPSTPAAIQPPTLPIKSSGYPRKPSTTTSATTGCNVLGVSIPRRIRRQSTDLRREWMPMEEDTAKRSRREASVNAIPGQNGHLLYVLDSRENRKWLVDGGAFISLIPPTSAQKLNGPNGTRLQAANGSKIDCFGSMSKILTIGDRSFLYDFMIADVRQPILGSDFLAYFSLAPNHRDGSLIDLESLDQIPTTLATGQG